MTYVPAVGLTNQWLEMQLLSPRDKESTRLVACNLEDFVHGYSAHGRLDRRR